MISFWNRKKDGSPKGETSASISLDDHVISRIRNQDRNGYDFDGVELSAIGRDVPEQITAIFNVSDINIARQADPYFLLTDSSGEVARRLNELVHLNIIDEVLSKAEQAKRQTRKDALAIEERITHLEKEIKALSWVEKALDLLQQYEKGLAKKESLVKLQNTLVTLQTGLKNAQRIIVILKTHCNIADVIMQKIDERAKALHCTRTKQGTLATIKDALMQCGMTLMRWERVKGARKTMELMDDCREELEQHKEKRKLLQFIKLKLIFLDEQIKNLYIIIKETEKEFPEVCPLCGKLMGKEP